MTRILGLNGYHGDSAACLVVDGKLIAAAEEERFRRIKHWAGIPTESIQYCLREAGLTLADLDHIAINRDPKANLKEKALYALTKRPSLRSIKSRLRNAGKVKDLREEIANGCDFDADRIRATVHNIEHHKAHLASTFFVSPFERAAVASVDGFGDFVSTMWGEGVGNQIRTRDRVFFPHSLGLFYLTLTQYLGFMNYGDEYKVMGLAPYGKPVYMAKMREIVKLTKKGRFELDLACFLHQSEGVTQVWDGGAPVTGRLWGDKVEALFGPPRQKTEEVTQHHRDIAASMQAMYEDAFFHILDYIYDQTGADNLALSGGCAMNSVANGKLFDRARFKDVYIQSAAGDAGGAIGAAYWLWNHELKKPRRFQMRHAYWGPSASNDDIKTLLDEHASDLEAQGCHVERIDDKDELCQRTAQAIADGNVIGWFQGRMEWGPRALGNRSILCDPRRDDAKELLNSKIKRRESFRPFAPSILRDHVADYFETDYDVPFMLQVFQICKDKRDSIPAVTHVNGSGRLQTVTAKDNPLYYELISSFHAITGVPILLNTSFNENEPVVCRPQEALACFLRTKMDVLVLENWLVRRKS